MNSHDLARLLLTLPDLPIATYAMGNSYSSEGDKDSHGPLKVGLFRHYSGANIIIGDIPRMDINGDNGFISEMLLGEAPWYWGFRRDATIDAAELEGRMKRHKEHLANAEKVRASDGKLGWSL